MPITDLLAELDYLPGYRVRFTDADYWTPFVRRVCHKHNLAIEGPPRVGIAGTYPTFIVDDRYVVKFFGRLFGGEQAFLVEREAHKLLGSKAGIPSLVAEGALDENASWPWPYLVYAFVPGVSIGSCFDKVSWTDRLMLARSLGATTRGWRGVSLVGARIFAPTWDRFTAFLAEQHDRCAEAHYQRRSLPVRLVDQIDDWLPPARDLPRLLLEPGAPPHLIHADLTGDHLLGEIVDGHWQTRAIIDFGDAMVGSVYYDLVALHLDLFRGDKRLLANYLDAYGLAPAARTEFARRAMTATLLHRFDVLSLATHQTATARSLDELATLLWQIP